ncbi:hypothetical protein [Nocardioides cynanchi]|nr:hypothetical protein [Nocardioides cynanchi]
MKKQRIDAAGGGVKGPWTGKGLGSLSVVVLVAVGLYLRTH